MYNYLKKCLLLCALASFSASVSAQMCLVDGGKPKSHIVLASQTPINQKAANMLQRFVKETSGAEIPISNTTKVSKGAVVIGEPTTEAKDDGFLLECDNGVLRICSAGGKGAIYGVAALLEKYVGVNYYSYNYYTLKPSRTLNLPAMHHAESPAFRFRQTFSYCDKDSIYRDWFHLQSQDEVFAGNMWVHTFDRLLPSSVYGKSHPEFYSFINGERRPGNHSQWCLSNPEILEIVAHKVDSVFKANPGRTMISISQNDGNNTNCQCPECKKVDEYEGSPSGNFIRFLNKLAARFPDKQFSTLAYLFTMHPPKHVKPLPNVNIMLCDIDCKREVPLTDNESGRDFVKALEGWAKISDNIFMWDYGINFDNMVSPFPNFHVLKPNIQLFKKNNVKMVFEQVNGGKQLGTDFGEMRAYIIEKLLWNPELDTDSLMKAFMNGYYGAAAPYIYRYQQLLQGALLSSGTPLWIYDSPITHKKGMLNDNLIKVYSELFDKAEAAVANDSVLLAHVQVSRLPLRYSELEIMRTKTGVNPDEVSKKLSVFRSQSVKYGITSINERNNLATDYCDLYTKRYLPKAEPSKAIGAKITWLKAPAKRYQSIANTALTDGLYGGTTFVESWVGWEGEDADFVMDLGSVKSFSTISTDFLHQLGQWILLPKSVTYYYSEDNKKFHEFGTHVFPEDRDVSVKFVPGKVEVPQPVQARYIRVVVKSIGLCPSWHYGVGYPAWFFIDEVEVN